ncbi:MAG TPA: FAD binding domain-containing protein [Candidatus Dormibacteraeota bacterium]|nr:FAD binding domain-containing protein [Candidatus Dormibacteraeota bacterium]
MLRLPRFRYLKPASAAEAASAAAEAGPRAALVAGGTDLLPKLKRRQIEVDTLIGLLHLSELRGIRGDARSGFELGALVTLTEASEHPALAEGHPGYAEAAGLVSSPALRNAGTVGGNLCVDTRCNYYDMSYEWRRSIGFCMKKDGDVCLVAPGSPRCWAVSSTDTAPVAIALGATVVLAGPDGERELPVAELYHDDGIRYLAKPVHEVVTALRLPPADGLASAYVKLRRRGSIDFPIAGAGVALRLVDGRVERARIVLSGVGSRPVEAPAAAELLAGQEPIPEAIAAAAELAARPAKPLDNADLNHAWRKRMVRVVVERALQRAVERARAARP